MTSPFVILALALSINATFAQDAKEEALILNQELQFLEDSVQPSQSLALEGSSATPSKVEDKTNLEQIYFGDDSDSISNRTAAPKRKTRGL